jgi:glycogen phosphorylase
MESMMNSAKRVSSPVYSLFPTEVEGFDVLAELALDINGYWNHDADEVWMQLDPDLWTLTYIPWVVLQTVARDKLLRELADPAFRRKVDDLLRLAQRDADAPTWFQQNDSSTVRGFLLIALQQTIQYG